MWGDAPCRELLLIPLQRQSTQPPVIISPEKAVTLMPEAKRWLMSTTKVPDTRAGCEVTPAPARSQILKGVRAQIARYFPLGILVPRFLGKASWLVIKPVRKEDEMRQDKHVMAAPQAAKFLGVDQGTLYKAAREGKIPHRRIGRRVVFSRDALLQWLTGMGTAEGEQLQ